MVAKMFRIQVCLVGLLAAVWLTAVPATAQVTAFTQALAEAAAKDKAIAEFYKARDYKPI